MNGVFPDIPICRLLSPHRAPFRYVRQRPRVRTSPLGHAGAQSEFVVNRAQRMAASGRFVSEAVVPLAARCGCPAEVSSAPGAALPGTEKDALKRTPAG